MSILEVSQLNNFQWDIKRREAKSNAILKCPSIRTGALSKARRHGEGAEMLEVLRWFSKRKIRVLIDSSSLVLLLLNSTLLG